MYCAKMRGVYAFCAVVCLLSPFSTVLAKDGKEGLTLTNSSNNRATRIPVEEFQWNEHRKLTWNDFQGPVRASSDESAAATHCGIGFKTNTAKAGGNPEVIVYNTFYTNKSWVRGDAKTVSILDHEQGHFDLCEIYTRKLRERMSNFNFESADVKHALLAIYSEITNEYESRQQAYEMETTHGTNISQQKKWGAMIASELN